MSQNLLEKFKKCFDRHKVQTPPFPLICRRHKWTVPFFANRNKSGANKKLKLMLKKIYFRQPSKTWHTSIIIISIEITKWTYQIPRHNPKIDDYYFHQKKNNTKGTIKRLFIIELSTLNKTIWTHPTKTFY